MLHRIATRLATLLLVAGLLAVPATAGAKSHHKRHPRHHLVKHGAGAHSVGRSDAPAPTEPGPIEPAPAPPAPTDPAPAPAPPAPSADAGSVASFTNGVLDVALTAGGDVTGKVIPGGTQFSCRSASTGLAVTDGCNASLLQPGAGLHEFSVNYASGGAWFQRIIVVLP